MVKTQVDNMLNELHYQLQAQGFGLDQLLSMTGRNIDEMKEERKEEAQKVVKSSLVLEAICKKEAIEATDEELNTELESMATMYNMNLEEIKKAFREEDIEDIKNQIKMRKTIDFLVENAKLA